MKLDLEDWKRRWKANSDEAERNAMMDSGWSKAVADRCESEAHQLLIELVKEFARPQTLADLGNLQNFVREFFQER